MYHVVISAQNDEVLHSTQYPVSTIMAAARWAIRQGRVGYELDDPQVFLECGYGTAWCAYTGEEVYVTCHEVEENIYTKEGA